MSSFSSDGDLENTTGLEAILKVTSSDSGTLEQCNNFTSQKNSLPFMMCLPQTGYPRHYGSESGSVCNHQSKSRVFFLNIVRL